MLKKSKIQVNCPPSTQECLSIKDGFQAFFILTNLATFISFIAFVKCLADLNATSVHTISILFGISYALTFILLLNFTRSMRFLNNFELRPELFSSSIQLTSYVKELPLAFIAFYYFTQVSYLKTTPSFHYYYLLALSIFLSACGILNCIVADKFLVCQNQFSVAKFTFLFVFRYFFFIARTMGLVIFLSTFNDTNRQNHQPTTDFVNFTFSSYLLILFVIYFLCYWCFSSQRSTRTTVQQIATRLLNTSFESIKLLIDFNDRYFQNKRILCVLFGRKITMNFIKLLLFWLLQIGLQIFFAYFWYIKALVLFRSDQSKTTLFSLLSKVRTRIALYNLYELEIKLKHRQLELITITGSFVIAFLSFHIYETYYKENDSKYKMNQDQIQQVSTIEKVRRTSSPKHPDLILDDQIDGFSIDTYQQSSSINTSSESSYLSPICKRQFGAKQKRMVKCSTCSSSDTDYSSNCSDYKSYSSLMMSSATKHLKQELFRSKTLSRNCHMPFYDLRRGLNDETSSGVETTTSSTSSSSDLNYSDCNDLNYLRNCQFTPSTWGGERTGRNLNPEFTSNNLKAHDSQGVGLDNGGYEEKVRVWFDKRPVTKSVNGLNKQFSFVQAEAKCSDSFVV